MYTQPVALRRGRLDRPGREAHPSWPLHHPPTAQRAGTRPSTAPRECVQYFGRGNQQLRPAVPLTRLRVADLRSEAERFVEELQAAQDTPVAEVDNTASDVQKLREKLASVQQQVSALQTEIDTLYNRTFAGGLVLTVPQRYIPGTSRDSADPDGSETPSTAETTQIGVTQIGVAEGKLDVTMHAAQGGSAEESMVGLTVNAVDEAAFNSLGRDQPKLMAALMAAAEARDAPRVAAFRAAVSELVLRRSRLSGEAAEVGGALLAAERLAARRSGGAGLSGNTPDAEAPIAGASGRAVRMVLVSGFESFNVDLYRQAAQRLRRRLPNVQLKVFSDRDLQTAEGRAAVEAALKGADVLLASLLFDYDQVEWLRARVADIPTRLVFESSLELMGMNKVGTFTMGSSTSSTGGTSAGPAKPSGPPPAVKKLLSMFGSGREEDKMVGYLSMLKLGPKLLQWVPGKRAADLSSWMRSYAYWNQGGLANVVALFEGLAVQYCGATLSTEEYKPPAVVETPALGCLHPNHQGYFAGPAEYMKWYSKNGPLRGTDAPVVGVLLYRKHVITEQQYIPQLITLLEQQGMVPVPIFINGVEAHTVVRDMLTSTHEQQLLARGETGGISPTLKRDAVKVDCLLSTIGFPLVGGPAGTMEGGRQAEVAKTILAAKDVPYCVAAPLLIQDMESWAKDGVAGLQSVVLYSLPELDGAIDALPLGALAGGDGSIYLVPERVTRLAARLKNWVALRRKIPAQRKVGVLMYGFPPGVGATGTAALLNVPASLEALLGRLHAEGYDLGPDFNAAVREHTAGGASSAAAVAAALKGLGEAVVKALTAQTEQRAISKGAAAINAPGVGEAAKWGVAPGSAEVSPARLREALSFPQDWGPNEWGPLPYLPDPDTLVRRLEKQWGELRSYRGLLTSASGQFQVPGVQLGNVWIGVQPPLGIEGDPMRLLFSRDLTPHPQYAAFYKWLQHDFSADAVLHLGMHGTVEWLPGAPLGNTGLSWSDVLLGDMPNVYIYAANNPSESIVAKRRGYGTIVSHNVPPYGRAGLYKQMATLRELLQDYREGQQQAQARDSSPTSSSSSTTTTASTSNRASAPSTSASSLSLSSSSSSTVSSSSSVSSSSLSASSQQATDAQSPAAMIAELALQAGLQADCPFVDPATGQAVSLTAELADSLPREVFDDYVSKLYAYLQVVETRLYSEGLHVLGAAPSAGVLSQYLNAYLGERLPEPVVDVLAGEGLEAARARLEALYARSSSTSLAEPSALSSSSGSAGSQQQHHDAAALEAALQEAAEVKELLLKNDEELDSVVHALGGGYVLPAAGGDLLRDGPGVLPTGRNIHALDPYRMPSAAAVASGTKVAEAILQGHREANGSAWPETVAVNLWGLDAIKTKGESVAIVLALVGARPVKEGTGRIARFELIPLEELKRPRVDVLCNMSGIFRDSFQNVADLLDDLFQRAASAPGEPAEMNFIKKHAQEMQAKGLENTSARLFSNPAGDYGSMVNERVGNGAWEDGSELGDTWASRNAFSYGRSPSERGVARPEVLKSLLASCDRVVQTVDSVEYGLTDIQEYYANTGALKRAAQNARGGRDVGCSIVEAFGGAAGSKPRELEEVLRLEYRSKLLNPRWAKAMAAQGSGGAYEISQRMTAMVGWGATVQFTEDWTWDQAVETYALDPDMADTLRKNNPQAFSNVLRRMLEAAGRGMWKANPEVLEKLKRLYAEMDDELEGVGR